MSVRHALQIKIPVHLTDTIMRCKDERIRLAKRASNSSNTSIAEQKMGHSETWALVP